MIYFWISSKDTVSSISKGSKYYLLFADPKIETPSLEDTTNSLLDSVNCRLNTETGTLLLLLFETSKVLAPGKLSFYLSSSDSSIFLFSWSIVL